MIYCQAILKRITNNQNYTNFNQTKTKLIIRLILNRICIKYLLNKTSLKINIKCLYLKYTKVFQRKAGLLNVTLKFLFLQM